MKKILIVEDEEQFRQIFSKKLESEGFSVLTAEDGQQALDILKNYSPDLILLDLVMPKMDGIEFIHHLRNEKKDIPIIILSNLNQSAYQSNIKDYLVKANTSLEDIVKKINEHLS